MIKDTDEQPDDEIQRVRSGRVLSTGASVPVEVGCVILPVWTNSPVWSSQKPLPLGILWKIPHECVINYQFHFQSSPLSERWVGELKIQSF